MSKASEWVEREPKRPRLTLNTVTPTTGAVYVRVSEGGGLIVTTLGDSQTIVEITAEQAMRLADWLLDTFGDA